MIETTTTKKALKLKARKIVWKIVWAVNGLNMFEHSVIKNKLTTINLPDVRLVRMHLDAAGAVLLRGLFGAVRRVPVGDGKSPGVNQIRWKQTLTNNGYVLIYDIYI